MATSWGHWPARGHGHWACHGQWPWRLGMATGHGQVPWPAAMAVCHGFWPWPRAMDRGHGERQWPSDKASERGHSPWPWPQAIVPGQGPWPWSLAMFTDHSWQWLAWPGHPKDIGTREKATQSSSGWVPPRSTGGSAPAQTTGVRIGFPRCAGRVRGFPRCAGHVGRVGASTWNHSWVMLR